MWTLKVDLAEIGGSSDPPLATGLRKTDDSRDNIRKKTKD